MTKKKPKYTSGHHPYSFDHFKSMNGLLLLNIYFRWIKSLRDLQSSPRGVIDKITETIRIVNVPKVNLNLVNNIKRIRL